MNDKKLSILYISIGVLLMFTTLTVNNTTDAMLVFTPGMGISLFGILTYKYTPGNDRN